MLQSTALRVNYFSVFIGVIYCALPGDTGAWIEAFCVVTHMGYQMHYLTEQFTVSVYMWSWASHVWDFTMLGRDRKERHGSWDPSPVPTILSIWPLARLIPGPHVWQRCISYLQHFPSSPRKINVYVESSQWVSWKYGGGKEGRAEGAEGEEVCVPLFPLPGLQASRWPHHRHQSLRHTVTSLHSLQVSSRAIQT